MVLRFAPCSLRLALLRLAQQPKKLPRIGYLSSYDPASESTGLFGIRLLRSEPPAREQGQNIAIEYPYAELEAHRD